MSIAVDDHNGSVPTGTTAGIPAPALTHFFMHSVIVSMPFCCSPFCTDAPRVTCPAGASIIAATEMTRQLTISHTNWPLPSQPTEQLTCDCDSCDQWPMTNMTHWPWPMTYFTHWTTDLFEPCDSWPINHIFNTRQLNAYNIISQFAEIMIFRFDSVLFAIYGMDSISNFRRSTKKINSNYTAQ